MHQRSTQIPLVLLVAIFLNYGWELAQSPLYVGMDDFGVAISHCFVASVGDGFLVLGIVLAGRLVFGTWGWFRQPGARGYLLMLAVGFLIGVSVEWFGVHVVKRWSYTDQMPRLPWINLGLLPVLQMLFLPALIFWIARLVLERGWRSPQ